MEFSSTNLPELLFGPESIGKIGKRAAGIARNGMALIVADPFLIEKGSVLAITRSLERQGIQSTIFGAFSGEPCERHIREGIGCVRECKADIVVGFGGGSALDIAKAVACTARGDEDPSHYALASNALPEQSVPSILIPTTAGTGSEANGTAIFSNGNGQKVWLADRRAKATLAILDPDVTKTLPPHLTAWCGMDAFVHAFEAATSRRSNAGGQLFAHKALSLIAGSLQRAVDEPDDLQARGEMLLGSFYAGFAIENCGTAIAHNISHALARFAPIHHGHATALAFEASLDWLVAENGGHFDHVVEILGLSDPGELPGFVSQLADRLGIERCLPPAFANIRGEDLANEMLADEHKPMREATARTVTKEAAHHLAARTLALSVTTQN